MATQSDTRFRVVERYNDCPSLQPAWDDLLTRHSQGILHFDVTSSFDWAMALWRTFLDKRDQQILVMERKGEIVGLLPLYRSVKTVHGVRCRMISPITELFSGRCGFLLRDPSLEDLDALLEYLRRGIPDWDVLLFTLVEGSVSHHLWLQLAKREGFSCEQSFVQHSPYIDLNGNWKEYLATLPKKFVSGRIRSAEKRLRARGDLRVREFLRPSDVPYYREAILDVEKGSWKAAAGTSLTAQKFQESFHMDLIQAASQNGLLLGFVLELDGQPIAYLHGVLYNNVFCNLKSSYKEEFRELSPGHVLRASVLERLYDRKVALYDFMGVCDEHKRVWTDQKYSRVTYVLYNHTFRARTARLGQKVRHVLRRGAGLLKSS